MVTRRHDHSEREDEQQSELVNPTENCGVITNNWDSVTSTMLRFWLTEPKHAVFATDVWSSERAISRPTDRTTVNSGEIKSKKTGVLEGQPKAEL
jgi:hypothetical protein